VIRKTLNREELEEIAKEYDRIYTKDSSISEIKGFHNLESYLGVSEEESRQKAVIALREALGGSWKQAAHLTDSIIDCWKHTGNIEKILEYNGFDEEDVRTAIQVIQDQDTYYRRLQEEDFSEDSGFLLKDNLNKLERTCLEDLADVEYFKDEEFDLTGFNVFSSKNHVVTSTVNNVKELDPEETGIVVNENSGYSALLKSMLDSEDITYHRSADLGDDQHFRNIISLIRTGLTGNKVRLRDLRLLLTGMGVETSLNDSNRFLHSIDDSELEEVKNLINVIEYLEFNEVIERYEELAGVDLDHIRGSAEDIGFIDTPVSQIDDLEFLVKQLNLNETESEGVKIISPYESLRLDRENVFILGMSSEWNQDNIERGWRDIKEVEEQRRRVFESVIQAGEKQHYMVIDQEMNQPVIPCFYLNQLVDKDFKEFTDLPHKRYTAERGETKTFDKLQTKVDVKDISQLSQTKLNSFSISPRVYYISELVEEADEINLLKGSLFHDFAEFYINYPHYTDKKGLEPFQDHMINELESLVEESELEKLETEVNVGLRSIRKFLKEEGFERPKNTLVSNLGENRRPNSFGKKFGKGIRSDVAEAKFDEDNIRGKIDLVLDTNHIVDYKSGRKKTKKQLVKSSTVSLADEVDWPDFQPAMYLSVLRRYVEDQKLYFTYYYFLDDLSNQYKSIDHEEHKVQLVYYPCTFQEHVPKQEVFEKMIKGVSQSNDRRKTLEKISSEGFKRFFEKNPIPKVYNYDELEKTGYINKFESFAKTEVGDYKYVEKGCRSTLRKLIKINQASFFKEDIDQVEEYVEESIGKINEYKRNSFPVESEDASDLPFNDMVIK
jgi:hypothetical protein